MSVGKGVLAILITVVYMVALPFSLTAGTVFLICLAAIVTGHDSAIHQPREVRYWFFVFLYFAWGLLIILFERRFRLLPKCLRKLGLAECLRPNGTTDGHR